MATKTPNCHPVRKYHAKGMCRSCYQWARHKSSAVITRPATCHPNRQHYGKGKCRRCWVRDFLKEYRIKHPEYNKIKCREARLRNLEKRQEFDRNKKTGITSEQRTTLFNAQSGKCAICDRSIIRNTCSVDHNHTTGEIRALLCTQCNTTLGLMAESPERLRKAATYLERFVK